jgi:hypothetical protein
VEVVEDLGHVVRIGEASGHIYRAKTLGGYRGSSVKSELSARDAWTGGNLSTRLGQAAGAGAVLRRSDSADFRRTRPGFRSTFVFCRLIP